MATECRLPSDLPPTRGPTEQNSLEYELTIDRGLTRILTSVNRPRWNVGSERAINWHCTILSLTRISEALMTYDEKNCPNWARWGKWVREYHPAKSDRVATTSVVTKKEDTPIYTRDGIWWASKDTGNEIWTRKQQIVSPSPFSVHKRGTASNTFFFLKTACLSLHSLVLNDEIIDWRRMRVGLRCSW